MFTKCEHCGAIFRVNMREVTIAKGQLRCGECHGVFSANASLSTSMPEPYSEEVVEYLDTEKESNKIKRDTDIKIDDPNQQYTESKEGKPRLIKGIEQPKTSGKTGLILVALILTGLLIGQVLYHYRHMLNFGSQYQPDKIQMLNHNVFAHPIEKGVLLISANIINTAEFEQAYPILEVRLIDKQSKVVALRRFKPDEYLDNYSDVARLKSGQETSLKLKIKDPGEQATRFQFNFL